GEVKKAREEAEAELEIDAIVIAHRAYSGRGRADPKVEERVERILWFYDNVRHARASAVWALGELGCRESTFFIGGMVKNWERALEREGMEFILAAVEALGKLAVGTETKRSLDALMAIVEDGAAPAPLREMAVISSERVAGRMGSNVLEDVRERVGKCGGDAFPRVKAWRAREKKGRDAPFPAITQRKGGIC
ncbi:MAG TPA: hypothetical protein PKJ97_00400, partial [Candidatus Bilamarchaeaceae archaeon]|nr:hypothetical protein [Candidatus Bilamarchaeaceae archaeon]